MKKGLGPARNNVPKGPYPSSSEGMVGIHLSVDLSHLGAICSADKCGDEGVAMEMTLDDGEVNANADPKKDMRDKVLRSAIIVQSW